MTSLNLQYRDYNRTNNPHRAMHLMGEIAGTLGDVATPLVGESYGGTRKIPYGAQHVQLADMTSPDGDLEVKVLIDMQWYPQLGDVALMDRGMTDVKVALDGEFAAVVGAEYALDRLLHAYGLERTGIVSISGDAE